MLFRYHKDIVVKFVEVEVKLNLVPSPIETPKVINV